MTDAQAPKLTFGKYAGQPLTVVRGNGRFVVHRQGRPIRVRLTNGRRIPVTFETRRAAECYVAVYQFLGDDPEK